MNLDSFTGSGSTPSRRRFWDKVTAYVIAAQKVAGRNVSVAEHQGKGTLINVVRERGPATGTTGACCIDGECSILSSDDCASGGGTYHGDGSTCTENLCCTLCGPILSPACFDGSDYWTGEGCDGCIGEIVPGDSNWLVDSEYCVGEDVDCSELCSVTTFDPVTCEGTVECFSNDCCASCVNGGVHTVSRRTFPCPEMMSAFDDPFFSNS